MKSNIFSLSRNSWGSYIANFIAYKESLVLSKNSFLYKDSAVKQTADQRKVYVTDMDRDVTFAGVVKSLINRNGNVNVSLIDVQVFEYSSSKPLFDLPEISFSRPENNLFIEEA